MNSNITHVFGKGQKLYRTGKTNQGTNNKTKFTYFTYDLPNENGRHISEQEYSRSEGSRVRTYKTTKPLKLLKLNTVAGVNYLRNKMAKDVTNVLNKQKKGESKALSSSFSVNDKNIVTRHSKQNCNNQVAGAMCRLAGYDGYITKRMKGKNVSTFHPEIVLCKPADKLKVIDNSRTEQAPRAPPKRRPTRGPETPKTSPIRRLGTPKTSPKTPNASPKTPRRSLGF